MIWSWWLHYSTVNIWHSATQMLTGKNFIRVLNNQFTFVDLIRCVQNCLIFELSINPKSQEAHPGAIWRGRSSILSVFFCHPFTHFACKWEHGYHLRLVINVPIVACHNWSSQPVLVQDQLWSQTDIFRTSQVVLILWMLLQVVTLHA